MKIKIRIGKYKKSGEPLDFKEFEITTQGSGLKEDPIILDSLVDIPSDFEILESDVYIIIRDCHINSIVLGYCENIKMERCTFRSIFLYNCSNIIINKCHSSFMNLVECRKSLFKDSKFDTELKLYKCYNNKFIGIYWDLFFDSDYLSRGNIFININKQQIEDVCEAQKPFLKISNSFSVSTLIHGKNLLKDVKCKGTGTIIDPIIIDNFDIKNVGLKDITMYHNRHNVLFRNLNLKNINLFDTKHVSLEDCNISNSIHQKFCSDIKISSISTKFLKFGACKEISIQNSDIKEIDLYKGYKGSINLSNCTYKKISPNALKQIYFS